MRRETLIDFFNDFEGLDQTFLIYDDGFRVERYTYAQTAHNAREFASYLRAKRIHAGDNGQAQRGPPRRRAVKRGGVLLIAG